MAKQQRRMTVSHIDLFYETRGSVHISRSDATNNPYTELKSVPEACEIRYDDGTVREVNCNKFDAPDGDGYKIARFLIERAMLDPDATVIPTEEVKV